MTHYNGYPLKIDDIDSSYNYTIVDSSGVNIYKRLIYGNEHSDSSYNITGDSIIINSNDTVDGASKMDINSQRIVAGMAGKTILSGVNGGYLQTPEIDVFDLSVSSYGTYLYPSEYLNQNAVFTNSQKPYESRLVDVSNNSNVLTSSSSTMDSVNTVGQYTYNYKTTTTAGNIVLHADVSGTQTISNMTLNAFDGITYGNISITENGMETPLLNGFTPAYQTDGNYFTGFNTFTQQTVFNESIISNGSNSFTSTNNTFTYAPHSSQLPVDGFDLANKAYVDAVTGNRSGNGITFYLNKSQSLNGYGTYSTTVSTASSNSVTNTGLTTNPIQLVAGFITVANFPEITTIPIGVWTSYIWGNVDNLNGSLHYTTSLYKYSSGGVETLLASSGESNDINALTPNIYTIQIPITTPITILTTDRLILKIFTSATSVSNSVVLTTYFEGTTYSYSTSTIGIGQNLLANDNSWTGENQFFEPVYLSSIKDSSSSTGTANQILSCGPIGGSVKWINPQATPSLSSVLASGNSAGSYDIEMNDKDINNVANIVVDGIHTIDITSQALNGALNIACDANHLGPVNIASNNSTGTVTIGSTGTQIDLYSGTINTYANMDFHSHALSGVTTINGTSYPPAISTLSQVMTAGNTASTDLNMNSHSISGVVNINGSVYPPTVATPTLSSVLTAGNTASTDINMNSHSISNLISLSSSTLDISGSTINLTTTDTLNGVKYFNLDGKPISYTGGSYSVTYTVDTTLPNGLLNNSVILSSTSVALAILYLPTTPYAGQMLSVFTTSGSAQMTLSANPSTLTLGNQSQTSYSMLAGSYITLIWNGTTWLIVTFYSGGVLKITGMESYGNGNTTCGIFTQQIGTTLNIGSNSARTGPINIGVNSGTGCSNGTNIGCGSTGLVLIGNTAGSCKINPPLQLTTTPTASTQLGWFQTSTQGTNASYSGLSALGTYLYYVCPNTASTYYSQQTSGSATAITGLPAQTAGNYIVTVLGRFYASATPTAGAVNTRQVGYSLSTTTTPTAGTFVYGFLNTPLITFVTGTQTNYVEPVTCTFPITITSGSPYFTVVMKSVISSALVGGTWGMIIDSVSLTRIG